MPDFNRSGTGQNGIFQTQSTPPFLLYQEQEMYRSMRKILVVTSASVRPSDRPYRLWGRGREVPRQTDREWGMPSFLGGKSRGAFGQPAWNRMTIVAFEKEVSLKSLSLFSKTIVRRYCSFKLEKKTFNTYNWKEKVQKNTGSRRKLQVTKAAFKGSHHRFVFFAAESLPCSETQPSKWSFKGFKVHDFEYLFRSKKLHFEIEFMSLEMCHLLLTSKNY